MKSIFLLVTVLSLLAMAGSGSPVFAGDKGDGKLLQNGGFEDGLNVWKVPSSGVELKIDPSGASDGEGFLRVTVAPNRTMAVSQEVTGLEPGQKYRVCARVRKSTSEDARFIVRNVSTSKYLVWHSLDGSDGWTPVEMSFTAPADGGAVSIEFNFRSPGACEIDEISLERQG